MSNILIILKGGGETMEYCTMQGCGYGPSNGARSFLTKSEKVEMLKEYKESLDRESQGVAERIAELEKEE